MQTYNAARHLDRCLEALKGFDEILVVDMESTDTTPEIARRHGARLLTVERGDHRIVEAYRDYAIHAAAHDWVLVVDADEIVPGALREYLYAAIEADPSPRAILIPIKNYFMGRWMRCYYPDYILRFFNRRGAHWPYRIHSRPSHAGPEVRIPASRTDLAFVHLANESVAECVTKMNAYTDREVERRTAGYRRWRMLTDPAFRFFKTYLLKGAWRDGMAGLMRAVLDANYRFTVLAKIEELRAASNPGHTDIDRDTEQALSSHN